MKIYLTSILTISISLCLLSTTWADRSSPVIDLGAADITSRLKPNGDSVTVVPGPEVKIAAGPASYPGVVITPPSGPVFDLSTFGHVQFQATNTGTKPIGICVRLDNEGDWKQEPWNSEILRLKPGASGSVKVYFGTSFGKPGYALKPDAITKIMLFAGKSDVEQSFKIEGLQAAGSPGEKPPVDPTTVRVAPKDGVIFGLGVPLDPAKQLTLRGATAALENGALGLTFAPTSGQSIVQIKSPEGRWDLRQALQVRIKVRNAGSAPITPGARLEGSGPTDTVTLSEPLAPGKDAEIVVPFAPLKTPDLGNKESLPKFASDATSNVTIYGGPGDAERRLNVISIIADVPAPSVPDWLGKRPPVEGDWELTLDENFNGNALNEELWMPYANNYWDANKTHFTKENVVMENGMAKLRYEKKEGFHNDDPNGKKTPYAVGYLRTYDKWTQRYGYFESRLKIPKSPGLWPGFWTVPDRGPSAGDGAKRQDTKDMGMEFDIMEHLTRWGPYRYNIAAHWDGYGKEHQALGSDKIYAQPDKDGYLTSGMLWLPGLVVFYNNGMEVARWENERVADVPAYLIFYMPSGGWDNDQTDDSKMPADFEIDYVRVWQRKDLASAVDRNAVKAK